MTVHQKISYKPGHLYQLVMGPHSKDGEGYMRFNRALRADNIGWYESFLIGDIPNGAVVMLAFIGLRRSWNTGECFVFLHGEKLFWAPVEVFSRWFKHSGMVAVGSDK